MGLPRTTSRPTTAASTSGSLATGKTYSHTFDTAGTFAYHCGIHPTMKAQVVQVAKP